MFATVTLQDWENLVKKQLKTDDIYAILSKENLEGISVKPYYDKSPENLKNLPKVEESTHLVAKYQEGLEEKLCKHFQKYLTIIKGFMLDFV